MSDLKKVLWISYLFPPLFCGVGRQVKVAKYLAFWGWRPIVLTVNKSVLYPHTDQSRMKDVPPEVEVHRTRSLETRLMYLPAILHLNPKWIRIPDQFIGWLPFAVREGLRIIREERIDAIFSTSLPSTCHLVGYALKKRTGLPWVADFRDLWTQNTYLSYPRPVLAIENRMEAAVVRTADKITTINDSLTQAIQGKYTDQATDKFVTITHGFDPADFASVQASPKASRDEFTITYTGSLYAFRRVDAFMHALQEAVNADAGFAQKTRVRFVGNISPARTLSSELGLEASTTFSDMVTHEKAWEYLSDSDMILFILGASELDQKASTGKLFEYLALDRPILALAPEGVASDIIRRANAGIVVNPNDKEAIKQALLDAFWKWSAGNLEIHPNREAIAQYDIRRISARFAAILDELTGTKT